MKKFIYTFIAVIFISTITTGTAQAASHSCPYVADANTYVVKFTPTVLFSNQSPYWTPFTYTNVPAGEYDITMYSYDNHSGHGGQNQTLETWRVGFYTNSHVPEVSSPESKDVPENSDTSVITHRDVKVPAGTKKMLAYHAHRGAGNYQSVVPICVKLEKKTTPLTGSCTVSDTSVKKGDTVTFTANAGGGDGSYTYKWSNGLTDTTKKVTKDLHATIAPKVTITSGDNQVKTVSCKTVVVENPVVDLNVSCSLSQSTAKVGENITFTANTTGGVGGYTYTWTRDLQKTGKEFTTAFDTPGTYRIWVMATDSVGNSAKADCSAIVIKDTPINDPYVSCVASKSTVYVGENVTFKSDVTKGSSNHITYKWSGAADGTSADSPQSFSSKGTYTATVKITDGNGKMDTASCSVRVIEKDVPNAIRVSCDTSDSRIEEGDSVRFSADTTGANGSVTYTWSGDVTGNSSSVTDRFNREGTYRGTVTATDSTGNTDSATCSVRVEEEEEDEDDLEVTCEVSDHRVEEGDTVTFTADVDGGAGSVDYDWRGDIDGDDRREKVRFNRDGEYEVTIRVEDRDGNRATDECRVVRVSDSGNVLGASIVASTPPQGEFAAVESVFLSQVPYTGPAETATMIALTTGLLAWAFFLVRFFMKRRNIQLQANRMEAFKAMNRG